MIRLALTFLALMTSAAASAAPLAFVRAGELKPFWVRPAEKTGAVQTIRVSGFQTMSEPVTNAEFIEFLKTHPDWQKENVKRVFADSAYLAQFASGIELKPGILRNSPVNYVSWFAAQAYCDSVGMRLPTVVEWEYMAAASETKADASRDPEFLSRILEWYAEPSTGEGLSKIGKSPANYYGVKDLHGLVWEWVEDFNSSLSNGEGRATGSLNRDLFCGSGSLAGGNKENYAAFMRFAFRSSLKGASTLWNLGFRCVKGEG